DVVAIAQRHRVFVWNIAEKRLLQPAFVHDIPISDLRFSHSGRRLLTCTSDNQFNHGAARLWNIENGKCIGPMEHGDGIFKGRFSGDDKYVLTYSEDFTAQVWESESG